MGMGGIVGFILVLLSLAVIVKIVDSGASFSTKCLWSSLVIMLPIAGLIAWLFTGPR